MKLGGGARDVHCGNFFLFESESYGLALIKHLLSVAAVFGREHAAIMLKVLPFVAFRQRHLLFPPLENVLNLLHFFRFGFALV